MALQLKNTFDYTPSVGWQLDPFGHSAVQASLLTSEVGFNALFFGRIDYQDLEKRRNEKRCEGVWSSSPSLGTHVFWGLSGSFGGNYGAPESFCFDTLCGDEPIVSNEGSAEYNLDTKVKEFVHVLVTQAAQSQGNNIMLTMGSDFQVSSECVPGVRARAVPTYFIFYIVIAHLLSSHVYFFHQTRSSMRMHTKALKTWTHSGRAFEVFRKQGNLIMT